MLYENPTKELVTLTINKKDGKPIAPGYHITWKPGTQKEVPDEYADRAKKLGLVKSGSAPKTEKKKASSKKKEEAKPSLVDNMEEANVYLDQNASSTLALLKRKAKELSIKDLQILHKSESSNRKRRDILRYLKSQMALK